MKKLFVLVIALIATLFCVTPFNYTTSFAMNINREEQIENLISGLINYKKSSMETGKENQLFCNNFISKAGTSSTDWYAFSVGRMNIKEDYSRYLALISNYVEEKYKNAEKLDSSKSTEWHRISLAILALGGNPRAIGDDKNGDGKGDIDLIKDGIFERVDENGKGILGKQGINGYLFALIALDSMMFKAPSNSTYNREIIISQILKNQLSDGGWDFMGKKSDPDMTAMAIQSLAPYYNSEKQYSYNTFSNGKNVKIVKKVREAVDKGINWLSENQCEDGGFKSWNMANCESCAQVIIALSSLGINIFKDEKFIKNGNTIFDKILKYRLENGGFAHTYIEDKNANNTSKDNIIMASEQALLGNISLYKFLKGERRLFDLRKEQSEEVKNSIKNVTEEIENLKESDTAEKIKKVYENYLLIDGREQSYVYNYYKLSNLLKANKIAYADENIIYNEDDFGTNQKQELFTENDKKLVNSLPEKIDTSYKTDILVLRQKIKNSIDFSEKQQYQQKINSKYNQLLLLENEIKNIKLMIKEEFNDIEKLDFSNRNIVNLIYNKYENLSDYDKNSLTAYERESIIKAKNKIDSINRSIIISVCCGILAIAVLAFLALNIIKRKKQKKMNKMEESDQ